MMRRILSSLAKNPLFQTMKQIYKPMNTEFIMKTIAPSKTDMINNSTLGRVGVVNESLHKWIDLENHLNLKKAHKESHECLACAKNILSHLNLSNDQLNILKNLPNNSIHAFFEILYSLNRYFQCNQHNFNLLIARLHQSYKIDTKSINNESLEPLLTLERSKYEGILVKEALEEMLNLLDQHDLINPKNVSSIIQNPLQLKAGIKWLNLNNKLTQTHLDTLIEKNVTFLPSPNNSKNSVGTQEKKAAMH